MVMKGLSWASLRKNPSLIPLFFFVGAGVVGATLYTMRVAVANPEINFNRKGNPEPWNEYSSKQYKFYSPLMKEENLKVQAPQY